MAAEEEIVTIKAWPDQPASLKHQFDKESSCPVRITFEDSPAHVVIRTDQDRPLDVNMKMGVTVKEAIPVCIKLCEPICAQSDYRIGIDIFDRPVASISIKGLTRLFNCRETPPVRNCVDFKNFPAGQEFPEKVSSEEVTFLALGGPLRTVTYGDPAGQTKLAFAEKLVGIEFPSPSEEVSVTLCNFGSPQLRLAAYADTSLLEAQVVEIANATQKVNLQSAGITKLEITGGSNEASIVEVCYTSSRKR